MRDGLRASGAASMQAAAADLRRSATELEKAARILNQDMPTPSNGSGTAPPEPAGATPSLVSRRLTVCGLHQREHQVPALRLSGKWLRHAGFELGQKVQVRVDDRRLTIFAE